MLDNVLIDILQRYWYILIDELPSFSVHKSFPRDFSHRFSGQGLSESREQMRLDANRGLISPTPCMFRPYSWPLSQLEGFRWIRVHRYTRWITSCAFSRRFFINIICTEFRLLKHSVEHRIFSQCLMYN